MRFYVLCFRNYAMPIESDQHTRQHFARKSDALEALAKVEKQADDELVCLGLFCVRISPGKANFLHWLNTYDGPHFSALDYSPDWTTTQLR